MTRCKKDVVCFTLAVAIALLAMVNSAFAEQPETENKFALIHALSSISPFESERSNFLTIGAGIHRGSVAYAVGGSKKVGNTVVTIGFAIGEEGKNSAAKLGVAIPFGQ